MSKRTFYIIYIYDIDINDIDVNHMCKMFFRDHLINTS